MEIDYGNIHAIIQECNLSAPDAIIMLSHGLMHNFQPYSVRHKMFTDFYNEVIPYLASTPLLSNPPSSSLPSPLLSSVLLYPSFTFGDKSSMLTAKGFKHLFKVPLTAKPSPAVFANIVKDAIKSKK
jgi:hypothetical protein